jgi:predicted AlkP superfamily pyrophosphatase or phosphodiesterase
VSAGTELRLPAYGERSLADLLPSLAGALGVGDPGPIPFPSLQRVCVLLVDGLGWHLLRANRDVAPFLARLLDRAEVGTGAGAGAATTVFPSTTATSLASLGTGLPPGGHGIAGFQVAVPGAGWVLNSLEWDERVDPMAWQPEPTVFQRLSAAGVAVTRVGLGAFDGSGLTVATMRGGSYAAVETAGQRAAAVRTALTRGERSLVYAYYGELDRTGHVSGCGSDAWREELAVVDTVVARIAALLPAGAALVVTADHGMVDVAAEARLDLADEPELAAGVRRFAGDPRARYLHVREGAREDVRSAWCERLGDRAWVCTREEVEAAGWWGPMQDRVRERFGDVVVAARGTTAVFDRRVDTPEVLGLVGHHGSLTAAEMEIPLLVWHARKPGTVQD